MISLDIGPQTKTSSKLSLLSKDTHASTLSFSALLSGLQEKGETSLLSKDRIQNGALVLALEKDTSDTEAKESKQSQSILSLLQADESEVLQEEIEALELNPKVTQNKTVSELKVLIQEAKQYLKDKITSLEGFKKSEIESLPKTLKGLTQVAQKLGLDLSKITLEEIKESGVKISAKDLPTNLKQENVKTPQSAQSSSDTHEDTKLVEQVQQKDQVKTEQKTLKETPLFKAQAKPAELTTQELVNTKVVNETIKGQKQKTENTLEALLTGKKAVRSEGVMTADFSVETAKVIAPTAQTEAQKSLESLLSGEETSKTNTSAKADGSQVLKADSFEVKMNEAKQMVKYISQDVKQAIDDYKAPFTRVKVQLNPQKLGEVDLTVVQRGKNLHINLSSNNTAINTLAMNANELRTQLNNNGIQNASLNFSNMSQGDQSSGGSHAHQQQHNRQEAQEEYGYFQAEETAEEIVNSLEIVVPHYA